MTDDERLRKELHAKIDAEADSRKRQIDEERQKKHTWLDAAPPGTLSLIASSSQVPSATQIYQPTHPAEPSPNGARSPEQARIPIKDDIDQIVDSFPSSASITSLDVYDQLIMRKPEIEATDPAKLKARISMALTRLVEIGVLKLHKKGGGNIPHIYMKQSGDDLDRLFGDKSEAENVEVAVLPATPPPHE
jgi:hypothetical protein